MPPPSQSAAQGLTLPTPGVPPGPPAPAWNAPWPPPAPAPRPPLLPTRRRATPRRNNLGWALLILGTLIASTLFSIHVYVMPLPVAAVYFRPAFIDVVSEPRGADVFVDGAKVLGTTPATVEVRRDHRQHTIEVRKEGFLPTTQTLRYDREVHMHLSFQLQRPARSPAP